MKIHKSYPENPPDQFLSDAPSIKAMSRILPFAALLSALSLAGGIAAFASIPVLSYWGLPVTLLLFFFAWHYDQTAVISGQSVVREFILIRSGMSRGTWFLANNIIALTTCLVMAIGSFYMSRSGIEYLTIQLKNGDKAEVQQDSTLFRSVDNSDQRLQRALDLENATYQDQRAAINARYAGEIQSIEAEIRRRESQRNKGNTLYIDNQISKLNKQIAGKKAAEGKALSELSAGFQARQSAILAKSDTLQAVALIQAQIDQARIDEKAGYLEEKNKAVAGIISAIFSYSVWLMLGISIRLTILETRNKILPLPIIENSDISGSDLNIRWLTALPAYVVSWWIHLSEKLYKIAPERPTPVIDDKIIDFHSGSEKVIAIRKSDLKHVENEKRAGQILDAVQVAENSNTGAERIKAFDLISMYLQTKDQDAVKTFYLKCVAYLDGNASNPFHTRTEIRGFSTQRVRDAYYNASRGEIREKDATVPPFSENAAKVVPEGMKVCEQCRTVYAPRTTHQRFCKTQCRSEYHRERGGYASEYKDRFQE